MLRVHTVWRGDLKEEAVKNKWNDHAVAAIKEITKVWLDSHIAQSVLLFFKDDESGDLHSYMPIIPKGQKNLPDAVNLEGAKGKAKIFGIEPYIKPYESTLEISNENYDSFRSSDDDAFVARIMAKNFWNGNMVFKLF